MASAAQQELAGQIADLAKTGVGAGCKALDKKAPGIGPICESLGKSATDIFTAFTVIEAKAGELGGKGAEDKLSKEFGGQWGSIAADITVDVGVCATNNNSGTCGGRTAARVAKAILKVRPLNANDGQPGTIAKLGQLSPVMVAYSKAVLYAAFGNIPRANKWWGVYTKNLAAYKSQNSDQLKLAEVEKEIVEVAQQLQNKWTAAGWEQLKVLKAQQAELKKKLGQPPPAELGAIFAPRLKAETLEKVKEAAAKRKAAEDAQDDIKLDPATIGAGAAVLALLVAMGRK